MSFKKHLKTSLLILLSLIISGCSLPVGGECKYETIISHAVVKEVKEDHVIVDYYTKLLFYANSEYEERLVYHLPPVHVAEVLPANLEYITKGSCTPEHFYIKKQNYFFIKGMVVSFSDDERKIEKDADTKISQVAQHFLALKKEYPTAKLILYARSSKGSEEYRYSTALMWHARIVKNKLLKKGLLNDSISMIAYTDDDQIILDFTKPLPKERVTFNIDLGIKKKAL